MTVQFPERIDIPSGDNPPAPEPGPVAEQFAIVGEDARAVPLQRLVVGKETTKPCFVALELELSVLNTAYGSLVTTVPFQIDRGFRYSFDVTYTPGVNGAFPRLYPQISRGRAAEVWVPVMAKPSTLVASGAGYTNPPAFERKALGYLAENLFEVFGTGLVAATPVTAVLTIAPDDSVYPSGVYALRFGLQDTDLVTPGTITIVGTQE